MDKIASTSVAVANVFDFWTRMAIADRRFLGLNYDGTLAPFRANRDEAHPLPGIVDLLRKIGGSSSRTVVAIISGRPVAELESLMGDLPITLIGCHGFETKLSSGEHYILEPSTNQTAGIKKAAFAAFELDLGANLEIKIAGLALHTRGLNFSKARDIETLISTSWSEIASEHQLRCASFNGGIEIRSEGWDKGMAVLDHLTSSGAEFSVYLGDDQNDEDVFRTLFQGHGVGIKIGGPEEPTTASGHLADCFAVRDFLTMWCSLDPGLKDGNS